MGATEDAAMRRFAAAVPPAATNIPQADVQARGGRESVIYTSR
jgi:hypothetical protein